MPWLAYEIETAVLRAAGVEQSGLTSKEQEVALQSAIRQVIFKADNGTIEIEFEPGPSSPDEVADRTLDTV